jgi:hypothetical protein
MPRLAGPGSARTETSNTRATVSRTCLALVGRPGSTDHGRRVLGGRPEHARTVASHREDDDVEHVHAGRRPGHQELEASIKRDDDRARHGLLERAAG